MIPLLSQRSRLVDMKTPLRILSLVTLLAAPTVAQDKLVIEAGRIITQAGKDIENGVIVIEDGRIRAIGTADQIEKPWDATVLGGPELVAFPGFVEAHTSRGMDRPNENIDVAPFLDIQDSVDPVSFFFEDCLRYGITTVNLQHGFNCVVGAQGMIVRPTGMTVEEMLVRPRYGTKISLRPKSGKSRATQQQALRETFDGLKSYLEELIEAERDQRGYAEREALAQGRELEEEEKEGRAMKSAAWTVDGLELIPRGAIDEKLSPLLDIVEGRRTVFLECHEPVEVHQAVELAQAQGFADKAVLVVRPACWRAADQLASSGMPVVLEGGLMDVRRNAVTGEEEETFVPAVLAEKGVEFAISVESNAQRSLWYQAAMAVGHGLSRSDALDAVTTTPAKILGLEGQVGSLEVGKLGNVVLFSGDPLSISSWVEHVIIEGAEVYDRAKDVRNKHLIDGTQPRGTAAQLEPEEHHQDEGDDDPDNHGDEEEEGHGDDGDDHSGDDEEEHHDDDEHHHREGEEN